MPFRSTLKKAFSGRKSGDDSPSGVSTPKIPGVEYYKPGKVPPSKYRGKWDQEHQDRLQSYSFSDAFGKRSGSIPSLYSPTGTKAQSRRSSYFNQGAKSDHVDMAEVYHSEDATSDQTPDSLASTEDMHELRLERTIARRGESNQQNSTPFSAEDLEKAMTAAALK